MFVCCYLLMFLFVLVGVAFLTLGERSILGVSASRMGPYYVSLIGLVQPIGDFLSLFMSSFFVLGFVDCFFWVLFPSWGLVMFFFVFCFLNLGGSFFFFFFGFVFLFCIYSLLVYMFVFGGWAGRSVFSVIASLRVVVQMVSYEVGYVFMFLVYLFFVFGFDYLYVGGFKMGFFWEFSVFFFFFWILVCMAELSRSPFDFLEGESELVSGFNLEYGGGYFSFIFLVEYGFLVVISLVSGELFFGMEVFFLIFLFFFILLRGVLPRLRYDKMMYLFWSDVLVFFFFVFVYLALFF